MSNIDSQLNDAILDAVGRYAGEMQDRFDTDGDPSLTNRPLWNAQVAAATNMLESELRLEIEQAFQRVNDLLDGGDFMASGEVVITQAELRELRSQGAPLPTGAELRGQYSRHRPA